MECSETLIFKSKSFKLSIREQSRSIVLPSIIAPTVGNSYCIAGNHHHQQCWNPILLATLGLVPHQPLPKWFMSKLRPMSCHTHASHTLVCHRRNIIGSLPQVSPELLWSVSEIIFIFNCILYGWLTCTCFFLPPNLFWSLLVLLGLFQVLFSLFLGHHRTTNKLNGKNYLSWAVSGILVSWSTIPWAFSKSG